MSENDDRRLGKSWNIISGDGESLGVAILLEKIGPGHFMARSLSKGTWNHKIEVYSCQLRGEWKATDHVNDEDLRAMGLKDEQ